LASRALFILACATLVPSAIVQAQLASPRDTVVWETCFRLDSVGRAELRPSRQEACGTIRLPERVLVAGGSGEAGTHTVPFDQLGVSTGPSGRVWAYRDGSDTVRVVLNTVLGSDTPSGRVFVTNDEAAVHLDLVPSAGHPMVPWRQESCWRYCARGIVALHRL
jgi:hypothetical protein